MVRKPVVERLVTLVALVLILSAFSPADRIPVASAAPGKPPHANNSTNSGPLIPFTPPSNDNFANATIINTVPFLVNGLDTSAATTEANDPVTPCGSPSIPQQSHSVWYRYTPSITGNHNINTEGSDYDTVLAVWTGSWGALSNQGCDDDGGSNLTSALDITLQSSTTYYIEAMAWGNDAGGLLNLSIAGPPPNDDFDNAFTITGVSYSNSEVTNTASTAADDPSFTCDTFITSQGSHSVWYRLSSPYRRVLTASTLGPPATDYDTVLGIFTGSRGALTLEACNDDVDPTLQSQAQVALQAGTAYFVEVVGFYPDDAGLLNFSATLGPICPDFVSPPGVGVEDIALIAGMWNQHHGPPYDYNGDGLITLYDIMQVTPKWGQNCLATANPPEIPVDPGLK